MSAPECFQVEQLEAVAAWPDGDPRRRHLDGCARCRARLAEYRAFVAPPDVPEHARLEEADARLAAMLERELAVAPHPARAAVAARSAPWWSRLFAPPSRPAWGLALTVLVIVAGGAWWASRPGTSVMRGARVRAGLETHASVSDSAVVLTWKPVEGAERYQVRFYSTDLAELATLSAPATRLDLRHGALPDPLPGGVTVLWQVAALRGGDTIATSRTRSVVLP